MPQSMHRPRDASYWRGVLFGRDREQTELSECLHDMLTNQGRLVLVSGEAGIGKTSLVRALANDAEASGARVLSSACYDLMVTPPYGPWVEIFSDLGEDDMGSLLPVSSRIADTDRVVSHDALFSKAFEILTTAMARQPIVIILEDLHWADHASLDFLRYVSRQISNAPLLIVATYRDTDLDRTHPLNQLLPSLVREASATRINLGPLDIEAMHELVNNHYGLPTHEEFRLTNYLQNRTEGNPFFIGEILRTLEEKALITPTASGWEVGDLSQVLIPPLVRQVIEARLTRIDGKSRELLEIASVIGQEVHLDLWRIASDASDEELSTSIKAAVDLNLLEETATPMELRFTHALIREALYYELGLPERRSLHKSVGEALAQSSSPHPDSVAYHFHEAGHEETAEWLMAAGERAQQLYAWLTAAERFESVQALLGQDSSFASQRGWISYRIGLLLTYAEPNRGITYLRAAEQIAHEVGDQYLAAHAKADRGLLRCLVGDVRRGLSEMRAGITILDHLPTVESTDREPHEVEPYDSHLSIERIQKGTLELNGGSGATSARRGALTFWLAWSGRYADAIQMGETFVDQYWNETSRLQDALGDALAGLGHAYAALGRPDAALDAFSRAREAYGSIDHHFKEGNSAIYELSEAYLPYRADRVLMREWLADQAEAG